MKTYFFLMLTTIFVSASCNKDPKPIGDYIRCKVDGQTYTPDNCANCNVCRVLGDTIFILGANRGLEAILIGITDKSGISIKSYVLNSNVTNGGTYKNSTTTNDRFDTDLSRMGILNILMLDKNSKKISGTFYFQAYNPIQNKIVNITEGEFRLSYTTN